MSADFDPMPGCIPSKHTKESLAACFLPVKVNTPPEHRKILIERTELVQRAFDAMCAEEDT